MTKICNFLIIGIVIFTNTFILAQATINGVLAGEKSGTKIAMSNTNRMIIGSPNANTNTGNVRIYEKNASNVWVQLGATINGEATNDLSGSAVAINSDGTKVAIGAPKNAGGGATRGHVRVYQYVTNAWVQVGADIDGEANTDESGSAVTISADGLTVVIGARYNDGNGSNSGHTRVYQYNGTTWVKLGNDIDGEAAGDLAGAAVAISANRTRVAIGAPSNDGNGSNSGHVRVYNYSGGAWVKFGIDLDGEVAGDNAGAAVAISADGNVLAIGAPLNRNGNTAPSAGHVRVYQNISGNTWSQLGADIDSKMRCAQFGTSLAMSSDGTSLNIGAPASDLYKKYAEVFTYSNGSWQAMGEKIYPDFSGGVAISGDGLMVAFGKPTTNSNTGATVIYQVSNLPAAIQYGASTVCNAVSLNANSTSTTGRIIPMVNICNFYLSCGSGLETDNDTYWDFIAATTSIQISFTTSNWVAGTCGTGGSVSIYQAGSSSCDDLGTVIACQVGTSGTFNLNTIIGARYIIQAEGLCNAVGTFTFSYSSTALPIELSNFSAKREKEQISIQWITESEQNNDFFQVERSNDGEHFEPIGKIKGKGNSRETQHYSFTDTKPLFGNNYYRLKQVDFDRKSEFSKIVNVFFDNGNSFAVFPNPSNDKIFIKIAKADHFDLNLYNIQGQVVLSQKDMIALSANQYEAPVAHLPKGVYALKMNLDGKSEVRKVVVE